MAIPHLTIQHVSRKDLIRLFGKITINPSLAYKGVPCWLFPIGRGDRYAKLSWHGNQCSAHRFFYAWLVGPIPKGRQYGELDHLCRNKGCVNPIHLEFISARINVLRSDGVTAQNARKTHCLKGHPLPLLPNSRNERVCKTCARQRVEKYAATHPDRYKEIRAAAEARYSARHPERRRETWQRSNRKRAEAQRG